MKYGKEKNDQEEEKESGNSTTSTCCACFNEEFKFAIFQKKSTIIVICETIESSERTWFTLKNQHQQISCLSACFAPNGKDILIAAGTVLGKIGLFRVDVENSKNTIRTELHWHSHIVNTVTLIDETHLLSGGTEGVLVLWKLDRGTSSKDFRPRLGASILSSCCLAKSSRDETVTSSCLLLLQDGSALEVEIPTLFVNRKIRAWIPSNSLCVIPAGLESTNLAVALDNHSPGTLTLIDANLATESSSESEKIIDIASRNAVSNAEAEYRWKIETSSFSPNGKVCASIICSSHLNKRELRIFYKETETLRVSLGKQTEDEDDDKSCLSVTNSSVALSDSIGEILIFKCSSSTNEYSLENILDVSPLKVTCLSLSDDESSIACLLSNGLVRVWNRFNSSVIYSHSVGTLNNGGGGGVIISTGSREIFAWTTTRLDSLIKNRSFRSGSKKRIESVTVSSHGVDFLLRDLETESCSLFTWNGKEEEEPSLIDAVEESTEWKTVLWGGSIIGWILTKRNGSIQTRGGKKTMVPTTTTGRRMLPKIKLNLDQIEDNSMQTSSSSLLLPSGQNLKNITEWFKDIPTHLLINPPRLTITWPPSNLKRNQQPPSTIMEQEIDRPIMKKSRKSKGNATTTSPLIVEVETEEERNMFKKAFASIST